MQFYDQFECVKIPRNSMTLVFLKERYIVDLKYFKLDTEKVEQILRAVK